MLEKNTKQVNRMLARIYARCTAAILVLVLCSSLGIFEFGRNYTMLILVAGLLLAITPSILIRYLPDNVMKYYMLILVSIFIGILGTNNHIGVYITYILVPVFSCLYFEPHLVIKMGVFSYIVMAVSIYINSARTYEVVYMGMPHILHGDAVRIKQVMLNYASNAIKYTDSGQIDVVISCQDTKDGYTSLVYTIKDTGATKNVRILITDDNEINREVLKAILEPFVFTIDEAENGEKAVQMASTVPYDLIFMDSHMPVMNGKEATRKIRETESCINCHTPIIAITADAITGVREELLATGMDDYIVKPIDTEQLCSVIRKYLPDDKILK